MFDQLQYVLLWYQSRPSDFSVWRSLLHSLSYDPASDTLISVGDIVAKGPHKGSMAVLSYMSSNNITAVRGNHDQMVIEWHSWLRWTRSLSGGSDFIDGARAKWVNAQKHGAEDVESWIAQQKKKDKANFKWWKRIPSGWTLFGDHFEIAYAMTDDQYEYMVSKPLKLHIPHAHAFVAHAGVLASDPRYKPWHKKQPLAKIPSRDVGQPRSILRQLQEAAILSDVVQNTDPWVTLNMRSVVRHEVTRRKEGSPWSELYNADMSLCHGFDQNIHSTRHDKKNLPCHPATVIYGHAASRGLDVKRWTIGLDTGCVYEERMTALVLGGLNARNKDEEAALSTTKEPSTISFGDNGKGKLVSVSCSPQ